MAEVDSVPLTVFVPTNISNPKREAAQYCELVFIHVTIIRSPSLDHLFVLLSSIIQRNWRKEWFPEGKTYLESLCGSPLKVDDTG